MGGCVNSPLLVSRLVVQSDELAHLKIMKTRRHLATPERGGVGKGGTQSWGVFGALKTCVLHATSIVFVDKVFCRAFGF